MNAKTTAVIVATYGAVLNQVQRLRERREAGQGTIEYVGLILLVGAALALAAAAIDGQLVQTVLDAVKNGINTALEKLGVSGGLFG